MMRFSDTLALEPKTVAAVSITAESNGHAFSNPVAVTTILIKNGRTLSATEAAGRALIEALVASASSGAATLTPSGPIIDSGMGRGQEPPR